jgi:glycosyltransferase involved in cell wall biosynthesis
MRNPESRIQNPEGRIQARMRIGVNALFLIPGEVGGSETYVRDVLTHAIPANPDLEWVLFTNRENHEALGSAFGARTNVRRCLLGFAARHRIQRILREQIQLPWRVRRERIDVLWSPGYTAPALATCPQVVSILDMQYKAFPQDLSRMALLATRLLVPLAARRADHVLTLSEFSRTEILKYIRISGERVQVVYPAVDGVFSRARAGGTRPAGVPEGAYVLCVANTYPHKNVHTLIQAMDMMSPRYPVSLVLVGGEGRGESVVQAVISRMRDPGRVIRLRRLAREDLAAIYQGAAAFVFPSLYEGFGLPVLEAMAAGAPVLTSRCGSIPEVGGECVRYFDGSAGDCARGLEELLAMTVEERGRMVGKARERAATFSWERTADEIVACLRKVADDV